MEHTTHYNLPYIGAADLVSLAPGAFRETAEGVDSALQTLADRIGEITIQRLWPVGSIFMSTVSTNPSQTLGGTWVRWGQGRVPVGVDENDADFKSPSLTGGEKTHKLTVDEMPAHNHGNASHLSIANGYLVDGTNKKAGAGQIGVAAGSGSSNGSGQAHNNLQPYVTCYMWKRTA